MRLNIPIDPPPRPVPPWWDGVSELVCDTSDSAQLDWLNAYIAQIGTGNDRVALALLLEQMDGADEINPAEEEAKTEVLYWLMYELNSTITTLLYDTARHGFDHERCVALRKIIAKLEPDFEDATQEQFEEYIAQTEEDTGDFFGEYLSDDSDDEYFDSDDDDEDGYSVKAYLAEYQKKARSWRDIVEMEDLDDEDAGQEAELKRARSEKQPAKDSGNSSDSEVDDDDAALLRSAVRKPPKKQPQIPRTCRILRDRVHPCGWDVRNDLMPAKFNGPFLEREEGFQMRAADAWSQLSADNAAIHYPEGAITDKVLEDLDTVNEAMANGLSAIDTLTETKFCVAQYRGVAYNVQSFNAEARRANREQYELRLPIYSASVFAAEKISPGEFYAGLLDEEVDERLAAAAQKLEAVLVEKRVSKPVTFRKKAFDNEAYALQHFYTNSYDGFHKALEEFFAKNEKKDEDDNDGGGGGGDDAERVFGNLLNAKNPFVSTGNTPRHALRYAYGTKYYEDPLGLHKKSRLRPRWRRDGRAERPYSGKVYVSLHPLSDYLFPGPLDVVTLHKNKKVTIGTQIVPERESSFPAHIPADRIVAEHVAKYPSFDKPYHPVYEHKYGLSEAEYGEFSDVILESPPHSEPRRTATRAIGEWLTRYHEARLIEMTRRIAAKRQMVLVYRDINGYFSIELPTNVQRGQKMQASRCASKGSTFNKLSTGKLFGFLPRKKSKWQALGKMQGLKFDMLAEAQKTARRFAEWIAARFTVHRTPPDGNCLFSAVAGALDAWMFANHVPAPMPDARTMRLNAVAYLRAHNPYHLSDAYLNEMARVATSAGQTRRWGGDHEIEALALGAGLCIRVYAASEFDGYFDHNPAAAANGMLCLYHVGGNHWEWLAPNNVGVLAETFAG